MVQGKKSTLCIQKQLIYKKNQLNAESIGEDFGKKEFANGKNMEV